MKVNVDKIMGIIKVAGKIIEDRELALQIEEKGTADYVTKVDLKVQEYIEKRLKDLYPDIQFMGEEKSNDHIDLNGKYWVLDPIDGTTNLIHDYKEVSISLALVDRKTIVLGFVYNPYNNEMFFAEKGEGAYLNEKPIHVSNSKTMEESLISIGTSPYEKELAEYNFEIFYNVFLKSQDIRRSGSAALDLAYVASGRTDGFFEKNLKLWDYAAGILLVEEAGGKVSKFNGETLELYVTSDVLVSNDKIHKELIELLK